MNKFMYYKTAVAICLVAAVSLVSNAADAVSCGEIERIVSKAVRKNEALQEKLSDRASLLDYRALVRTVNGTNVWTAAMQKAIDENEVVVIPPGSEPYFIDATVVLRSNRRIEAKGAIIRLVNGMRTVLFRNENARDGTLAPVAGGPRDRNIAIVGGRWEDCCMRRAGYGRTGMFNLMPRRHGNFYGVSSLIFLNNCDHVSMIGVTFSHAGGFAVQVGDGDAFRFEDITFDNCFADGLHLNGNLTRVLARRVRGQVGDDLVALNAYDWLRSSVDFGPQRYILCEDLELVRIPGEPAYPAIRIQPAKYRYADGSVVDCSVSDVIFRRVKGITTFKMYLQTPRYPVGSEPEWAEVGSGGNLFFSDIEIDLDAPIDMIGQYVTQERPRGHFAAFELGANLSSVHFKNIDIKFHADRWPLTHLVQVGPKSCLLPGNGEDRGVEIFDPYVSCRVGRVVMENVRAHGFVPADIVHVSSFSDINDDGRSTGRGVIEKIEYIGGTVVSDLSGCGWKLDGAPVSIPHTWNADDYDKGFADDDGVDDFRRKVDPGNSVMRCASLMKVATYTRPLPSPKEGRRYFVKFDGVCEKAVVRVNGRFAGRHVGAFTPFCFEVTDFLQPSQNQLEVEVDNRYDAEIPPASADFTMCGGIYRKVELFETGMKGIDPSRPIRLWPDAATGKVRAEVPRLGGEYVVQEYDCGKVDLWTPENPKLYEVEISLDGETVTRKVGFRTVEFREDGFYLNGVKRTVRGVNRHQDMAGKGWALSPEDEEHDIRLIKDMGCDAVRLCHYPQSESIYRLCDELGLLVWSEMPNVDYLTLTETYRQNALNMAREMIEWRGSHPCVAWWSCFNELYSSGEFKGEQPFLVGKGAVYDPAIRLLHAQMKSLDPTRPVVAAACRRTISSINAIPDQIGFNIYPGWYGTETMSEWIDIFLNGNPKYKCFAMSEYGAGGAAEQHQNPVRPLGTQKTFDHSEEYMTMVHISDWRQMQGDSRLWGAFIWCFNDFGASDRYEGVRPGVNDKGLVTADRKTLKDSYFFYKANWNPEPMLHLCSKRMTSTTNSVCDVVVFSNLAAPLRLKVNGEKRAELMPDEVATAEFKSVELRPGANEIVVECGNLSDKWCIERKL